MEERLLGLIHKLALMREETLKFYLDELDNFTAEGGNPQAVDRVGILTDLDKHITNLHLEVKRIRDVII